MAGYNVREKVREWEKQGLTVEKDRSEFRVTLEGVAGVVVVPHSLTHQKYLAPYLQTMREMLAKKAAIEGKPSSQDNKSEDHAEAERAKKKKQHLKKQHSPLFALDAPKPRPAFNPPRPAFNQQPPVTQFRRTPVIVQTNEPVYRGVAAQTALQYTIADLQYAYQWLILRSRNAGTDWSTIRVFKEKLRQNLEYREEIVGTFLTAVKEKEFATTYSRLRKALLNKPVAPPPIEAPAAPAPLASRLVRPVAAPTDVNLTALQQERDLRRAAEQRASQAETVAREAEAAKQQLAAKLQQAEAEVTAMRARYNAVMLDRDGIAETHEQLKQQWQEERRELLATKASLEGDVRFYKEKLEHSDHERRVLSGKLGAAVRTANAAALAPQPRATRRKKTDLPLLEAV